MNRCPCISLRHGVFVLAVVACAAAQSKVFFGWTALRIVNLAHDGNALAFLICSVWGAVALLGLYWTIAGYQATRTHYDAVNGASVLWSGLVIALCLSLLQDVLSPRSAEAGAVLANEIARAFVIAWLTGNVVNLYLQLRGLFPGKLPLREQPQGFAVNTGEGELRAVIRKLSAALEQVTEERNRLAYDVSRKPQLALDVEAMLHFPGMRRVVLAALHPDKAQSNAERTAQTRRFQTASAVFDRIGGR